MRNLGIPSKSSEGSVATVPCTQTPRPPPPVIPNGNPTMSDLKSHPLPLLGGGPWIVRVEVDVVKLGELQRHDIN